MPHIALVVALAASVVLPVVGARAQTLAQVQQVPGRIQQSPGPLSAGSGDRFIFEEVDEGILRLDTRAGEVSICGRGEANWICRGVPDDRNAIDAEIGRLQAENTDLRRQLAEKAAAPENPAVTGSIQQLGQKPAAAEPPPAPAAKPTPEVADKLPEAQDRGQPKRVLTAVNKIWRRLVEMMANLRSDFRSDT